MLLLPLTLPLLLPLHRLSTAPHVHAGVWSRYDTQSTGHPGRMWCTTAGKDAKGRNMVWAGGDDAWILALDDNAKSYWFQVPDLAGVYPYWNDITAAGETLRD
jgi:hypothetical protein